MKNHNDIYMDLHSQYSSVRLINVYEARTFPKFYIEYKEDECMPHWDSD